MRMVGGGDLGGTGGESHGGGSDTASDQGPLGAAPFPPRSQGVHVNLCRPLLPDDLLLADSVVCYSV